MTSSPTATPKQLFTVLLAGSLVLLVVHTLGRFIYTPLLPYLVADNQFSAPDGAAVATWNYLGYLMGAMLAIRWHRIDQIRFMLPLFLRSEERRVGKECRGRGVRYDVVADGWCNGSMCAE